MSEQIEKLTKLERLLLFLWVLEKFKKASHDCKFKNIEILMRFIETGVLK